VTVRRKEPARRRRTESSVPPRRISHTSLIVPEEAAKSGRGVVLTEVPAALIDRLLVLLGELPVASGEEAVVRALVDSVGELLPMHAVGVCYVAGASGEQRIFACVPVFEKSRVRGADPTRVFPGFSHERVFDVAGVTSGTTLHLAGDDVALDDPRSPPFYIARRAAEGLSRALEHARAYAAADDAKNALRDMADGVIQTEKLASFGELAAGLVHELNNPLTSIVAYSDLLLKHALARGEEFDPSDTERIRRVGESAQRILRFTRDVVAYVRPSDDDAIGPVAIHDVLDRAFAFCEHVVDEAQATVERRFDPHITHVRGVAERLTQVFVNVVTNACHALPPRGGQIVVETSLVDDGRRVRIVVADTGSGITAENMPHIFAPFFTTKTGGRGTGLGLAIVRSIVEGHDGTVVASSPPGRGARFVIELPVSG
jgi:two-component system, NtrC family, sensor kinase